MAEKTIADLAAATKTPVEHLLAQIKDAGLPQTQAEDLIDDEQCSALLASLRGAAATPPRRITLRRKSVGTLKTSDQQGRSKDVHVEVRKKRTYIKRSVEEARAREREAQQEKKQEAAPSAAEEAAAAAKTADAPAPAAQPAAATEAAASDKEYPQSGDSQAAGVKEGKPSKAGDQVEGQVGDQVEGQAESAAARAKPATSPKTAPTDIPPEPKGEARKEHKKNASKREAAPREDEEQAKKKSSLRRKGKDGDSKNFTRAKLSDDFILDEDEEFEKGAIRRTRRKLSQGAKAHKFQKPTEFISRQILAPESITVEELARRLSVKSAKLLGALASTMGETAVAADHVLDQDTAILLIEEMGHTAKPVSGDAIEESFMDPARFAGKEAPRAPVVTVMGHVDHGKTSLLDYLRKSSVTAGEAGGITQHIGAYRVATEHGMISFLDTPGHAAFSAMRLRGAQATDIVILVVAADDGVKPQTEEAMQHAQAAEVPIVVALNKIDKEDADAEKVKNELAAKGLTPEQWGGDTQFIEVSALTGKGIPELLEAVLLQAELLELKAVADCPARGVIIESRLDRNRGPIATALVQQGTLKVSDTVLAGHQFGRTRLMMDENGKRVKSAGPSVPVEILGLNGIPEAGDEFVAARNEKQAREVAEFRLKKLRENQVSRAQPMEIDNLFTTLGDKQRKTLNIVLKTDVRGSLEAIASALDNLGNEEVEVRVIASGVGGISETDAQLAQTSKAVLIGFNARADQAARDLIENEGLELRYYSVIYQLIDDVKSILSGLLSPELTEEIVGVAEVRDIFMSPKFGSIAGSMVIEGTVYKNKPLRVLRDNVVIYEGELESLRRFREEASEVRNGMECGIGVKNYTDVQVGDKIEIYEKKEIARTLA